MLRARLKIGIYTLMPTKLSTPPRGKSEIKHDSFRDIAISTQFFFFFWHFLLLFFFVSFYFLGGFRGGGGRFDKMHLNARFVQTLLNVVSATRYYLSFISIYKYLQEL